MISHHIITKKPIVSLPSPSNIFNIGFGQPKTQEEYDQYIANAPIKVGDYVVHQFRSPERLADFHYVMYVTPTVIPYSMAKYERGHPRCFTLIQLDSATNQPWIRKTSHLDYRKATKEELATFIEPQDAILRDYLQKYSTGHE